jgi:superfamily II DNA or RNA helicase
VPLPLVATLELQRCAEGQAYTRGAAYFRSGAVTRVAWDEAAAALTSVVRGSRSAGYRCTIRIDPNSGRIRSTQCTCPMDAGCKHVVATLLASNAELGSRAYADAAPAAASSVAPVGVPGISTSGRATAATGAAAGTTGPTWRDLLPRTPAASAAIPLALGVELRQRTHRAVSRWTPSRIDPVEPRQLARDSAELQVGLRPLMRSRSTGAWIKGDVSWDAVRRPGGGYDDAQARWFAELHSIAHDVRSLTYYNDSADWLTLDTIASALLWPHLSAAAARGIPFVGTRKHTTVRLVAPAEVSLEVSTGVEGALVLGARVVLDGVEWDAADVRPVARTGLYGFTPDHDRIELTLAPVPLDDAAAALLGAGGAPAAVPAAEVEEFLRDALPRLRRRAVVVAGTGFVLPRPVPPQLVLSVVFGPKHTIEYRLQWRYGTRLVPWEAAPDDPDRDVEHEQSVRRTAADAWATASALPLASSGLLRDVDAAEFATHVMPALDALDDVTVATSGKRPDYRELDAAPEITVSTVESTQADWFDLGVVVTIDGHRIPFTPLFTALALRRKSMMLADGAYFSLAHPALQRLRDLIDEAGNLAEWEAGTVRISRYQTDYWADFEDLADEAVPAVSWRAAAEGLRGADGVAPTSVPAGLRAELRPYQKAGFDWLAFLGRHRLGGILADDMGLGKTVQMLAAILHAHESGERRPVLVIAPTSVLGTWRSEAARFVPSLRVAVVDATAKRRAQSVADTAADADILVTSYTLSRLDAAEFAAVEWATVVLDEAQFVKNPQTKLHRAVRDLRADRTIAITGTPLENSLTELWALLSLTAPGLLPSARRFRDEYVGPIELGKVPENQEGSEYRAARLRRLRRRIRPLVLRRTKELVANDLPAKQEQALLLDLSPAHRALYDTVLQRERRKVLGLLDDLDRNRFIVFRSLTLLRMLSLAPALVDPEHAHISSSKLDALMEQLPEVVAEGHRALVFSQFTSFLSMAADRLDAAGIRHAWLDGSTRRREEVIQEFRSGDAPVFLISLKAGGFGLTLTEADYVFLLDPWWNPAAEAQAVDRSHRIGQSRSVFVYRLIAAGTIEEKVLALQQRKARLFRSVMDDDALFAQALTAADIRGLFEA